MTEKRNAAGQTLAEFLKTYSPGRYDRPSVTVDMVVLTHEREVLLIRRADHPNIGKWALPGGFLEMGETLYQAAQRELKEETGLADVALRALGMFGEVSRDPRTRIITAGFWALANKDALLIQAGDDAADARLFTYDLRAMGEVDVPNKTSHYPEIDLPCTPLGTPLPKRADGYVLTLC